MCEQGRSAGISTDGDESVKVILSYYISILSYYRFIIKSL